MLEISKIRMDCGLLKGNDRNRVTDNGQPVFSWSVLADGRNRKQSAFRVRVWEEDAGTLWDTGWRESGLPEVPYDGAPLPAERRLQVTVAVQSGDGEVSPERTEHFFRSALEQYPVQWIAAAQDMGDAAVYFKKDFTLSRPVKRAVLYACGLGYHSLLLNGEQLDDAVLDPAFSDYTKHCYFTMLPGLEKLLQTENCLAVAVGQGWRRNIEGYLQRMPEFFGIPQLAAVLSVEYEDGSKEVLYTDESWLYGGGPVTYAHLFNGETYDASRRSEEWLRFGTAPAGFASAVRTEGPGGRAAVMRLEPIREQEIYPVQTVIPLKEDVCVVDFGQNIAGVCALRLPQGMAPGQTVRLSFSEFLDEDGSLYMATLRTAKSTDTYIAAGDERDLTVWKPQFTYHGFRYAEIHGLGMIDPEDIWAVSCYTDAATDSFFRCGSAVLNAVQHNIVQTEKANIHSILTDCPQRDERMGWMNDATVRMEETPYHFDIGRLFPKVVQDLLDTQSPDGAITCTAPYIYGFRPADPVCSSFLIAARQAYLHTGNKELLRQAYPGFALWEKRLGELADHDIIEYSAYGDWAAPVYACIDGDRDIDATKSLYTPNSLMSTGYYYYNATLLEEFANILEKPEDAARYRALAERIRSAMLAKWWDEENSVMATGSQGCQSFALWLGIIPEEHRAAAARHIHEDLVAREYRFTTGNLCTRYLLDALTEYGYVEDAWRLMTREDYPSFGYMLQNEATTIWERFELKKSSNMNSHNHPMYGSVGYWFYAYLAGVRPVSCGFRSMEIRPVFPRHLLSVNAQVETVCGNVVVRWVRRYGKAYLYVTLPFSTEATVYFAGQSHHIGSGFHCFETEEAQLFGTDGTVRS